MEQLNAKILRQNCNSHEGIREFRTPFPLRDIRENPRSNVRACAAGDDAICSKNRKTVPYHGANPNTRNGARLRSPSPIMAPVSELENTRRIDIFVHATCYPETMPMSRIVKNCVVFSKQSGLPS